MLCNRCSGYGRSNVVNQSHIYPLQILLAELCYVYEPAWGSRATPGGQFF